MKKDRWLRPNFTALGVITVIIAFSGCAFLDSPVDTSSVTPSTSTQHVSYQQRSNQRGAQPSNDQMQVLSARLGLSSANPVAAGLAAYSKVLETLG